MYSSLNSNQNIYILNKSYFENSSTYHFLLKFSVAEEPDAINEFSNAIANNSSELLDDLKPQALIDYFTLNITASNDSCGRINIMGTIVQDAAPYLFPFIIEYSLIGAAVIYCMWKHIGRNPRYSVYITILSVVIYFLI